MKTKANVLFSDEDFDLMALSWGVNKKGYVRRSGLLYGTKSDVFAHRLVLARVVGRELTKRDICDHINGNKLDNRRVNLRIIDRYGSAQNRGPSNRTGLKGVTRHKCGKWQASVKHKGKFYYCGIFDSPEAAADAALNKRKELGFVERS